MFFWSWLDELDPFTAVFFDKEKNIEGLRVTPWKESYDQPR